MSFLALATMRYDECVAFYEGRLGARCVRSWDRPNGRGSLLEIEGLRLEILDAEREERRPELHPPGDRVSVALEVDDVMSVWERLERPGAGPVETNWGARLLSLRDPDGVAVVYLQWLRSGEESAEKA